MYIYIFYLCGICAWYKVTSVGWKDATAAESGDESYNTYRNGILMHYELHLRLQKAHLVLSTCVVVSTSGHALIGDVQQHSQVQDQRCWWWRFGRTGINNELRPVMYGSFLNSAT